MLHDDGELFEKLILKTSESLGINPKIVELDYCKTLFLQKLVLTKPGIVLKGGTSLSKCYHLTKRFSDDIDLNIEGTAQPTSGQRRRLSNNIKQTALQLGLTIANSKDIQCQREFNRFRIDTGSILPIAHNNDLIIEVASFLRSYPCRQKPAASFIYEYLALNRKWAIIEKYNLEPFPVTVQSAERTFIDKLFALGDYYIENRIKNHSKHLYDLHKLYPVIVIDDNLVSLYNSVKHDRSLQRTCPSAKEGEDLKLCLQEILDSDAYRNDYNNTTGRLVRDDVSYEATKKTLQSIINSRLFC